MQGGARRHTRRASHCTYPTWVGFGPYRATEWEDWVQVETFKVPSYIPSVLERQCTQMYYALNPYMTKVISRKRADKYLRRKATLGRDRN